MKNQLNSIYIFFTFIQINMLPSVNKRISFIHVRTCVQEDLNENEKSFIHQLSLKIENRAIFENQQKYSNWKPTFIDEIDFTLFN
jgi:hypothetical protein